MSVHKTHYHPGSLKVIRSEFENTARGNTVASGLPRCPSCDSQGFAKSPDRCAKQRHQSKGKAGNFTVLTDGPSLLLTKMVRCGTIKAGWVGGNGQSVGLVRTVHPSGFVGTAATCLLMSWRKMQTAKGFAVLARTCKFSIFYCSHKH